MLMLFVEASKTVWQSRSYGEGYGSLHEGGTELVEMPFGAQLASCTLAESIRFSGFTPYCLLVQHAWFYRQRATYSRS